MPHYKVEPAWRVCDAIFSSEAEARTKADELNGALPRRKRSGWVVLSKTSDTLSCGGLRLYGPFPNLNSASQFAGAVRLIDVVEIEWTEPVEC